MTIISSEVDSPSTWLRPMKMVRAGTKRTPPPTPTRPPASPPATASSPAITSFTSAPGSRDRQLDRDRDEEHREEQGDRALRDPLLDRGADQHAGDSRHRKQQP